ncbi:sulfotransferase family cytosolic 1B member 1-like [Anoplophora glabripennis]|uniref:sulfotransferase family cytosolic 1B member 1-like n=1 Tax=Anoplophora glabripennis TaxID=217634 RepID=UPI000C75891D|nr:sulfotransferase family cytosolic 1B member 1-like [Anoplophora glabripennis]XP_023313155.1 sulfotransferase family cytosolic 1B member 1-like [Anoplophora glabripennis]XP_023313156.1 sulfotransferase family cytosolic 1B member 1-like [Anoplophora glabripennis]
MHCEMVWQIENDLDFKTVENVILIHRFPIIDLCLSMGDLSLMGVVADTLTLPNDIRDIATRYSTLTIDNLAKSEGRRFIRSHLPISLLSPSFFQSGCKVIYCARNPKDLVVSYYHILQFFKPKESESVSFKAFWNAFRSNWTIYSPYFEHLKEAWKKRNEKNFMFLFYEDTMKDLKQGIVNMAEFLGKELTNDQQERLVDYLNIDRFKKNKSVNCQHLCDLGVASTKNEFIREGGSGGWRKYFFGDLEVEVEEWISENLKNTDLVFPKD